MAWLSADQVGQVAVDDRARRLSLADERRVEPGAVRPLLLDDGDDVAGADRLAGATRTSLTRPAFSALTLFSIFMASSTQTVWPTSTVSPTATRTLTIVPCMGTATVPGARRRPPPPSAASGRPGRRRPRRGGHGVAEVGHPQLDLVAPAVDLGGDVARAPGAPPPRPRPARAAVAGRRRRDAGQVERLLDPVGRVLAGDEVRVAEDGDVGGQRGGDPSMTVSSMARSMRRRAASRSWPQTTSLATRLS